MFLNFVFEYREVVYKESLFMSRDRWEEDEVVKVYLVLIEVDIRV